MLLQHWYKKVKSSLKPESKQTIAHLTYYMFTSITDPITWNHEAWIKNVPSNNEHETHNLILNS